MHHFVSLLFVVVSAYPYLTNTENIYVENEITIEKVVHDSRKNRETPNQNSRFRANSDVDILHRTALDPMPCARKMYAIDDRYIRFV